jgi:hypothetical protein
LSYQPVQERNEASQIVVQERFFYQLMISSKWLWFVEDKKVHAT